MPDAADPKLLPLTRREGTGSPPPPPGNHKRFVLIVCCSLRVPRDWDWEREIPEFRTGDKRDELISIPFSIFLFFFPVTSRPVPWRRREKVGVRPAGRNWDGRWTWRRGSLGKLRYFIKSSSSRCLSYSPFEFLSHLLRVGKLEKEK